MSLIDYMLHSLSIAAKRMAAENVLVKDLQGVETLGTLAPSSIASLLLAYILLSKGSLTLLATDKTGTLTRNQMTVSNLWSSGRMYSAFQSNNDDADTTPFTIDKPGHARDGGHFDAQLARQVRQDGRALCEAPDPRRRYGDGSRALCWAVY